VKLSDAPNMKTEPIIARKRENHQNGKDVKTIRSSGSTWNMAFATGSLSHAMIKLKPGSSTNTIDVKSLTLIPQKLRIAKREQSSRKKEQTPTAPNKQFKTAKERHTRLIKLGMHSAKRCQILSTRPAMKNQKPS